MRTAWCTTATATCTTIATTTGQSTAGLESTTTLLSHPLDAFMPTASTQSERVVKPPSSKYLCNMHTAKLMISDLIRSFSMLSVR